MAEIAAKKEGKVGSINTFGIPKGSRFSYERYLRDLHEVGYLSCGPVKVDQTWDDSSTASLKEFLSLNGHPTDGQLTMKPSHLELLRKEWVDYCFAIDLELTIQGVEKTEKIWHVTDSCSVCHLDSIKVSLRSLSDAKRSGRPPFAISSWNVIGTHKGKQVFKRQVTEPAVTIGMPSSWGDGSLGRTLDDDWTCDVQIAVEAVHPRKADLKLSRTIVLDITKLKNVTPFFDDKGERHFFASAEVQKVLSLKQKINDSGGKLMIASGLRTWGKQMQLWKDFRLGRLPNPANQPGTSAHQAALAIDIGYWQFGLTPAKVPDPVPKIVEDEETRQKFLPFLEKLDQVKDWAFEIGFSGAGAKWKCLPWALGFEQTRRQGTITSVQTNPRCTLTFTVGKMPKGLSRGCTLNEPQLLIEWPTPCTVDNQLSSPAWVKDKAIVWTVDVEGLPPAAGTELKLLCADETGSSKMAQVAAKLTVTKAGKQHQIEGKLTKVKACDTLDFCAQVPGVAPGCGVPINARFRLHGADATVLGDPALTAPGEIKFVLLANEIEMNEGVEMPTSWVGISCSVVTEDRNKYGDRFKPAFQSGMSEKHHIQVNPKGGAPTAEGFDDWLAGLNKLVKRYQASISTIAAKGKWAMSPIDSAYEKETLQHIFAVGNVPSLKKVEDDFKELAESLGCTWPPA